MRGAVSEFLRCFRLDRSEVAWDGAEKTGRAWGRASKRSRGAIPDTPREPGLSLRGQVLAHVVQRAVSGTAEPKKKDATEMVPGGALKMARAWRRNPEGVMVGLE